MTIICLIDLQRKILFGVFTDNYFPMNTEKFIDKRIFLQLREEEKGKVVNINRSVTRFVNEWLRRNYMTTICLLAPHNYVIRDGKSSIDKFGDAIERLCTDPTLFFNTQKEADEYLDRELFYRRFIIQMKTNTLNEER